MAISAVLLLIGHTYAIRSRTAANVALALVTLAGIFTAYIVNTDLFYPENIAWLIVVCFAALFTLFVAFRLIDEFRWGGLALTVAAAVPAAMLAWQVLWPMLERGLDRPGGLLDPDSPAMWFGLVALCICCAAGLYRMSRFVDLFHWGVFACLGAVFLIFVLVIWLGHFYGEGGDGYYSDGWEDHPGVQSIIFQETPNLYFVGFDSITPETIMQKHMGIETTDFHRVMEEEMRRFRNLFANSVPTTSFYRTLMALDLDIFAEHREATGSSPDYFSGHDLSPLVWILRENGYETTSIYDNTFFGYRQGRGIDNYIINRKGTACPVLDPAIRSWVFWGYCWNRVDQAGLPKGDFLLRELTAVNSSKPYFVIAHLGMPGHSPKIFDYDNKDDRERFLERFEKDFNRAAVYLEQIVEHVKANDPNAILFVYGDHGAWLSRGRDIEEDPQFFLQDRFATLGGVYPPHRCTAEFDEAESKGYITSLDVVHAILECLSRGESPLLKPRNDRFWGRVPGDHDYQYKDFLYE